VSVADGSVIFSRLSVVIQTVSGSVGPDLVVVKVNVSDDWKEGVSEDSSGTVERIVVVMSAAEEAEV